MIAAWNEVAVNDWPRLNAQLRALTNALRSEGTYTDPTRVGGSYLWVDSTGDLRIKATAPTSDTDGTVVGTQT